MKRSEIRHALYRAKNGVPVPSMQEVYDLVEPKIPSNQSWNTFSVGWDITYRDGVIEVIIPEVDYDFIHSTCLEIAIYTKSKQEMDLTPRQHNVKAIVESNMLDGIMEWSTYNKTWGVSVDLVLKRIDTRWFKTVVNKVTDEMIAASVKSDGAAMVELPTLPVVQMPDFTPMSDNEIKKFEKLMKKKSGLPKTRTLQ